MSDFLQASQTQWFIPLAVVLALLLLWLLYRKLRSRKRTLAGVLSEISYDRIDDLVIPNGDEGEILIDHLLLTSRGLLIVDIKDVVGTVFGSDKMQDWTVIGVDRRYTFSNPQHALYDRIAALKNIVKQVPVAGRILFLDGGEFTKGVPELVCDLDDLLYEFGDEDKSAAATKIEAFKPHWDLVLSRASEKPLDNKKIKRRRL